MINYEAFAIVSGTIRNALRDAELAETAIERRAAERELYQIGEWLKKMQSLLPEEPTEEPGFYYARRLGVGDYQVVRAAPDFRGMTLSTEDIVEWVYDSAGEEPDGLYTMAAPTLSGVLVKLLEVVEKDDFSLGMVRKDIVGLIGGVE